jgi:hypothetical protein
LNARGASLQGQTSTLTGASPNSIVFADRPVRGHLLTEHLLGRGSQVFTDSPLEGDGFEPSVPPRERHSF